MKSTVSFCIATFLNLAGVTVTCALPLECNGNLVSVGDTEKQVLAVCGEPASRDNNRWTYQREGSFPEILIFADGVVSSIKQGDEPGFGSPSPLGDHP